MNFTPEHVHVMINHIPIVGFAVVAVLLLYAFVLKERHTLVVGLGLCAVLAVVTSVVMWTGEEGHERLEQPPLASMIDEPGGEWLETHEGRAEYAAITAYVVGGLAVVGLVVGLVAASWRRRVAGIMLLLVLMTVALMAWVADAGGKIRHPEFRAGGVSSGELEGGSGDETGDGESSGGETGGTTTPGEAGSDEAPETDEGQGSDERESAGESESNEQRGGSN